MCYNRHEQDKNMKQKRNSWVGTAEQVKEQLSLS